MDAKKKIKSCEEKCNLCEQKNSSCKYNIIKFTFSKADPNFQRTQINVSSAPFIDHVFIETPIYNKYHEKIGYKTAEDYVQQLNKKDEYSVKISSTYYFGNKGESISWQYNFKNNIPSEAYPVNKWAVSNIICGTGKYYNVKGYVMVYPKEDGTRYVKILYK